jgi:hypothetical protein
MGNTKPNKGSFKKGNKAGIGNAGPGGRGKFLTQALISQLNELDPKTKMMRAHKVVDALIKAASGGDVPAIKEIFDRIEGKVPMGGNETSEPIKVTIIGGLPDVPDDDDE